MLAERSSSSVWTVARRTPIASRAGSASSPLLSRRLLSDGARGVGTTASQRTRDNGEHSPLANRRSAGIVNDGSNNNLSNPFSASPSAFQISPVRHASSSSSPHPSSSSAPATATRPPNPAAPASASTLTWNDFLQLRKTRRRYNLVASVTTGLGTAFTGAGYLATSDLNQLSNVLFGLDPFLAMGMSTVACGALGWLIGPIAGSGVFNMLHRKAAGEMLVKEKDFFHRIQKYRADISAGGNLQNTPFPDYYGEKIDSVAAYRQWLRDQRKFSRKREYRPT